MSRIVRTETVGTATVKYESEFISDTVLDTSVKVNDQLVCVIVGADIDNFNAEFQELVDKYEI